MSGSKCLPVSAWQLLVSRYREMSIPLDRDGKPELWIFLSLIHNFNGFELNFRSDIHLVVGLTLLPEFYPCFSQRLCHTYRGCWVCVGERKSGRGCNAPSCMCCWAEPGAGGSGEVPARGHRLSLSCSLQEHEVSIPPLSKVPPWSDGQGRLGALGVCSQGPE